MFYFVCNNTKNIEEKWLRSLLIRIFNDNSILEYKLAEWGYWSACSASCRMSINDPIRYRTRSYCLRNDSSSYECNNQAMISYEYCDVVSCSQGNKINLLRKYRIITGGKNKFIFDLCLIL